MPTSPVKVRAKLVSTMRPEAAFALAAAEADDDDFEVDEDCEAVDVAEPEPGVAVPSVLLSPDC